MEIDLQSQAQLYLGLFEREIYQWLKQFSNDINTGIDIGAGQGEYTLYLLVRTTAKKIFAFEPSLEDRTKLQANVEINCQGQNERLEVSAKFLGSRQTDTSTRLDDLVPLISFPCLIKMDVDGGEIDILMGATRLLQMPDTRWIIETHSQQLETDCIELLTRFGYVVKVVPNAWWRTIIPELRPSIHNRWLVAAQRQAF
jgi:hypothetical protein